MIVVINAINLRAGGGITVAMNFLQELVKNKNFHKNQYYFLAPKDIGYEKFNIKPIKVITISKFYTSPLTRIFLDYIWLKSKIEKLEPDVVFTMGNIAIPGKFKQAVLFMFPYAIYPDEKYVWSSLDSRTYFSFRLRNLIFRKRLKYASIVFPQTKVSERRLWNYYRNLLKKTKVIPTAYSVIGENEVFEIPFQKTPGYIYLFCLTRYYPHKNLEVLIPLAKKIKESGLAYKIIITIDSNQHQNAYKIINDIIKFNLSDIIINLGNIPINKVPSVYSFVDALLLPTLLESFSATYIDSMTYGVPIFTSDRDFAHEICGNAAFYFDPLNVDSILKCLNDTFKSSEKIQKSIEIGREKASKMSNWGDVVNMYLNSLEELNIDYL